MFLLLGRSCSDFGLPAIQINPLTLNDGSKYTKQENFQIGENKKKMLNNEQKHIFESVINAVFKIAESNIPPPPSNNCIFINGPAGSGKTFLLEVHFT